MPNGRPDAESGEASKLPGAEVTYRLQGCCFSVHNGVGIGFDEAIYHRALEICFAKRGIEYVSHEKRVIEHRGRAIKTLELDLLAERVILELKSIQADFAPAHYAQLLTYLKAWQLPLGLLVNFGRERIQTKRVVFTEPPRQVVIEKKYLQGKLTASEQAGVEVVERAARGVLDIHGLGYGDLVYREMLLAELACLGVACRDELEVACRFESNFVQQSPIDSFVVADAVLVGVVALRAQTPYYNICKMRTHLTAMNLNAGLVINFGKTALHINGVHAGWQPG